MYQETENRHIVEILAPDGPRETISISAEQAARITDISAFAEHLASFTREDYYGDAPYDLLVHSSQFAWNQYGQFAAVLIKAAQAAEVEDGVAEAAVKMYRDIFISMAGDANDILSAIRAAVDDVQTFMNSKADYSKKMIDELWLTLSMILNAAVEDGLISINPAKSKRLRNPSTKKTERQALTSAEADDIEAHLQDIPQLRDRRYVAMLLKFPARCEDIRGLQIKDFNFEEKTVTITKGVTYAKGHTIIGDPKTPAGKRKMLILPGLLEVLELSQEELNDPEAYILSTLGDPHTPLSFQADRRLWERVKKAINVYGKTPHCFRHTFATRAHRAGVDDKTLQSMGGWKDLSTMKNVYIHTQQEDLEIARAQLAAV